MNGSVRFQMTAGCHYEESWTLTSGMNLFDMGQEYKEWRWAEILELPLPIKLQDIGEKKRLSLFAFYNCYHE